MICDVRIRGKAIVIQCGCRRLPMWLSNRVQRRLPRLVLNLKKRREYGLVGWDKSLSSTFFLKFGMFAWVANSDDLDLAKARRRLCPIVTHSNQTVGNIFNGSDKLWLLTRSHEEDFVAINRESRIRYNLSKYWDERIYLFSRFFNSKYCT